MMTQPNDEKQGPRNDMGAVSLTAYEKRAVRGVASAKGLTESDVLRNHTITDILEQFERIRAALESPDPPSTTAGNDVIRPTH